LTLININTNIVIRSSLYKS